MPQISEQDIPDHHRHNDHHENVVPKPRNRENIDHGVRYVRINGIFRVCHDNVRINRRWNKMKNDRIHIRDGL